jgi:hypothetical protein
MNHLPRTTRVPLLARCRAAFWQGTTSPQRASSATPSSGAGTTVPATGKQCRTGLLLAVLVGLFGASGASCPFFRPPQDEIAKLPPALPPSASLQDVIAVVNRNSAAVQSFSAREVSVAVEGYPTLRGSLFFERGRSADQVRLKAGLALTGLEVDLGSNDELFWIWIRRSTPAVLYYCRHEEFASSSLRREMPLDPYLLVEAFGLTYLDPNGRHEGPIPVPGGYTIRSIRQSPQGPVWKVTTVDGRQGLVLEQQFYEPHGQLVAEVTTPRTGYRRDPFTGLFLPGLIQVKARPPGQPQFSMELSLVSIELNQPIANRQELFAMPIYKGWPAVNSCQFSPGMGPIPAGAVSYPHSERQAPAVR